MPATPKTKQPSKRDAERLTPKQLLALTLYTDPKSPTFGNMTQSFLGAGFSPSYADNVSHLMPGWLSGFIGENSSALAKVERNIHKFLDLETKVEAMGMFGPITRKVPTGKFKTKLNKKTGELEKVEIMREEPIYVENPKLLAHQLNMTQFVAERLAKAKYGVRGPQEPPGTLVQNFTQINIHAPAHGEAPAVP